MPDKPETTVVVILRFPTAEARQTFGRWLKRVGRSWGCTCKAFWPIEAEQLTWHQFRTPKVKEQVDADAD